MADTHPWLHKSNLWKIQVVAFIENDDHEPVCCHFFPDPTLFALYAYFLLICVSKYIVYWLLSQITNNPNLKHQRRQSVQSHCHLVRFPSCWFRFLTSNGHNPSRQSYTIVWIFQFNDPFISYSFSSHTHFLSWEKASHMGEGKDASRATSQAQRQASQVAE